VVCSLQQNSRGVGDFNPTEFGGSVWIEGRSSRKRILDGT
jgi:hypothetical protein